MSKKVVAGNLKRFLKSRNIKVEDSEVLELMKIGCELGYLYEEDIIYMSAVNSVKAQNRLTMRRHGDCR